MLADVGRGESGDIAPACEKPCKSPFVPDGPGCCGSQNLGVSMFLLSTCERHPDL